MSPYTSTSAQFDVELEGTGFTNVIVQNNIFGGKGVKNIDSYPNVRNNWNYGSATNRKEFNSGTATLTSGTAPRSVTVNHDLCFTPTAQDIIVVGTNNPTNDPGHVWTSGYTSTQFTLNCRNDPGSNATFAWWGRRV
jgi:hypothetical protein